MATKKENRKLAVQLVEDLGLDVIVPAVDDLKSSEWADMVSDLKAKKRDADNQTMVDPEPVAELPAEIKPVYYVRPGCAITSRKGVLASLKTAAIKDCTVIEPAWFSGGAATLENLVASGHIGKR